MSQPVDLRKTGINVLEVVNLYVKLAIQDATRQQRPTTVSFDGRELLRIKHHGGSTFEIEFLELGREIQQRIQMTYSGCAGHA